MREGKQGPCQGAATQEPSPQIISLQPHPIKGRAKAIALHCKRCIYDQIGGNGTWREQTRNCTSFDCALWSFRPLPCARVVPEQIDPAPGIASFRSAEAILDCEG